MIVLSKNLMTELKSGRKKGINAETANKLASYFGVTVAYLLGVDDQPEKKEAPSLSEDAVSSPYVKELIRLVDSASPEKQKQALDLIKVLLQEEGRESGQV